MADASSADKWAATFIDTVAMWCRERSGGFRLLSSSITDTDGVMVQECRCGAPKGVLESTFAGAALIHVSRCLTYII